MKRMNEEHLTLELVCVSAMGFLLGQGVEGPTYRHVIVNLNRGETDIQPYEELATLRVSGLALPPVIGV